MLTSKVDPLPYMLTGFVLPRLWLCWTREASVALDAKFVALGFEELDASPRIVPFVRDCLEKKLQPRGFCVHKNTKKVFENMS